MGQNTILKSTNQQPMLYYYSVENQKFIQEAGSMRMLIQQLTETTNEELSKTVKYLLHLCVATGKIMHM